MDLNYIMPRGFLWVLPKKCPLKRHSKLSPKKPKKCRLKSTKNWAPLFCSGDLARVVLTGRQKRRGQVEPHCQESAISIFAKLPILSVSMGLYFHCHLVEAVFSCRCLLSEGELGQLGGKTTGGGLDRGGRVGSSPTPPTSPYPQVERAPLVAQSANCRPQRLGGPRAG